MIATREFEFETEWGEIKVTADIDISSDIICVVSIGLENKVVISDIKEYIEEWMHGNPDFDAVTLRQEEREWDEAQRAEADREARLIGDDEC